MSDYDEMIKLAKELKKMAMEKNIPIISARQYPPLPRSRYQGPSVLPQSEVLIIDGMYLLSLPVKFKKATP